MEQYPGYLEFKREDSRSLRTIAALSLTDEKKCQVYKKYYEYWKEQISEDPEFYLYYYLQDRSLREFFEEIIECVFDDKLSNYPRF